MPGAFIASDDPTCSTQPSTSSGIIGFSILYRGSMVHFSKTISGGLIKKKLIASCKLCPNCARQNEKGGNLRQSQATLFFSLNVGHVTVNASFRASCQKAISYRFSDFKSSWDSPEGGFGGFDSHAPPPIKCLVTICNGNYTSFDSAWFALAGHRPRLHWRPKRKMAQGD